MKKLLRYYLFFLFFISTHFVQSQNLTISTTGQTGTSGTNWSITGNTLTATGTADINASVINNHLATNALTVSAGSVTFNANISSTTANSLSILSNTFITNSSATTITTNGGSILFASNVDDATDGESTTNGYIQLRYGITINTSGGNITFGGGNTSGSEYSLGSSNQAYTEGVRFDTSIALNSGGGNITLRGKSYAMNVQEGWGASGVGFYFFSGATGTINSGTGTIIIDGYSQTNISSYASGIYSMHDMTITSANTTANAIRLIGKATGSSGDAYGIETENIFSVIATGTGGGITISSSTQNADTNDAVFRGETNILAKSGAIQLLGKQDGGAANGNWYISNNFYLGSKSSTSVSTSSSNITIQYDKYSFSGFTPKIATSGTLKLLPASASFGANVYTSWFSWNQNSQTMSGLTIGKSGNTASSIVLDSQLSVAGSIAAYGGTIYLYNNLTTTNAGAVSFYSDNAIVFDALRTVTAAGSFNYIPQSTFFVAAVTYPITNLTLSSAGLLIGNTTNTANITFDSATTTAGPITAYGGAISLNANLSSTATNADILLKATTNINQAAATTVTTTGGVVNFWADSDDNSTGYVQLLANATINSNGGNINLGGGSSLATDFAFGTAAETCPEASPNTQYISGVHMRSGSNLNSSGGNISIRGTNANISNAAMSFGVSFRGNTINSGSGKIAINGVARGSSSANAQGVTNWGLLTLRSSNTTSDAISIIGDASATVNSLSSLGINLSTLMEATGAGGGISISGKSGTETGGNASVNISGNILAVSGPITLSGDNSIGVQNNINFVNTTVIGKKTGTNVTASTSNVILEGNVIAVPATVSVDCSGTFTVRSFGNTFASALSWPMTNVSLASSISGLTIGKKTNSANVTFANATTIAGPITAYGEVIALSANLTTTNNGDISLYSDNAISVLTALRTISAAGSFNYIPRSDFFSVPVSYPITNLNLSSAGLLIGKPTNTANITFANATSIAGPITAFGGTITLNANLTTTNNGSISLYSDNPLGLGDARTLTAAGAFKYIPRVTTFTADVTYPITNLTATSTGLTIGNTTNTKNITINQDVTGGAGIELYGANVNINSNLKTTNSGAMYLKGNTTIAAGKYIESNGNFTHDGNLTFKSTATGTAAFGSLGGNFYTVSGTTTVERYIPAKRGWRLLTAPLKGSSNNSIFYNWQNNGAAGDNSTGMVLWDPQGTATPTSSNNGLFQGPQANIYSYATGWQGVSNTNTTNLFETNNTNAFLVFTTGPHAANTISNSAAPSVTTLNPKGTLITGNVPHSLIANQYKLIANPYASPINTETLIQANSGAKAWLLDPTIGTYGGYVAYDGINWAPTAPVASDKYIQSGQGFFVRAASNTTFNISESHKIIGNSNTWFNRSTTVDLATDKIRVLLYKQDNTEWLLADGILAVNSSNGNNAVDDTDTNKIINFNENIMFRNGATNLAIEYSALPQVGYVQPMRLTATTVQPYQLRLFTENYTNTAAIPFLEDTAAGTFTPIPTDGSVLTVPFTGIVALSTAPEQRFRIVYQERLLNNEGFSPLWATVYPNPVKDGFVNVHLNAIEASANFTITNLVGQRVHKGKLESIQNTIALPQLPEGVYLLSIVQEGKHFTTKLYIN